MTKANKFPFTQQYLHKRLHYNKKTGVFTWKFDPDTNAQWNSRWAGKEAGSPNKNGYILVRIGHRQYMAHRLAWFYEYGEQPEEIDHEDTIKNHNWIDNLRPATRGGNTRNVSIRKDNTSGFKGVHKIRSRWMARIKIDGDYICLGTYATPEEASAAYIRAAKLHHREFARWGDNPPGKPIAAQRRRFARPMGRLIRRLPARKTLHESERPTVGFISARGVAT